jgi:hypothetical protein
MLIIVCRGTNLIVSREVTWLALANGARYLTDADFSVALKRAG